MLEKRSAFGLKLAVGVAGLGAMNGTQAANQIFVDPTPGLAAQEAQETAFQNASGPLTLIDFEDQVNGSFLVGNEYAGLGITFSQPGGQDLLLLTDNPSFNNFTPRSGENALFADGGFNIIPNEDLRLDLSTPQLAVGLWLIDSEADSPTPLPEKIEFYAADTSLIASIAMPSTGYRTGVEDGNFFVGLIAMTPIATVRMFDAVNDIPSGASSLGETVGWDDIQFGVPEPATMAMLLLGSVAMIARPKRRIKA